MSRDITDDNGAELAKIIALLPDHNIDTVIHLLEGKLEFRENEMYGESNTDETLRQIGEQISSGQTDRTRIIDLGFFLTPEEERLHGLAETELRLAIIYTYAARKLYESDHIFKAWQAVSEAQRHIGFLEGYFHPSIRKHVDRARSGGLAKSRKMNELKEAVKAALLKKKPKSGWQSSSYAADHILEEVTLSLSEKKNRFAEDRGVLIQWIRNLCEEDNDIHLAYRSLPPAPPAGKAESD